MIDTPFTYLQYTTQAGATKVLLHYRAKTQQNTSICITCTLHKHFIDHKFLHEVGPEGMWNSPT